MDFTVVVACDSNYGIGYYHTNENVFSLPWHCKEDMIFFKDVTTSKGTSTELDHAIIMVRNTYQSFPNNRPLPNRKNIVVTSEEFLGDDVKCVKSLFNALDYCRIHNYQKVFVIGGSQLYTEAFKSVYLRDMYISFIPELISSKKANIYLNFPNDIQPHEMFTSKCLYRTQSIYKAKNNDDKLLIYRYSK